MKTLTLAIFAISTASSFATTIIVTNNRGPTATREVVDLAGTLVTGFGGFGIINEAGITGATTSFAGLEFQQFGLGGGAVSTSTSGQFSFTDTINIDTPPALFSGKNIYLLVGFGGSNLATSTEMFIYKFASTFVEQPTPITATLSSTAGTTLFGTEFGTPATTASGRYRSAELVPEPSAALLGAVGALGLLRRRRN